MVEQVRRTRPPLVLIANDQEWSARSLESILVPNGYEVVRSYTGQQTLERAAMMLPDVIILDAQMPDMHGVDVCRTLRANPEFGSTTPIFITTAGPSGRTQRIEAYRAGAWEFLGQPLDGEALLPKLDTFVRCKLDVDGLREDSLVDQTSGLYNMRGLARRARELGAHATRRSDALACVVFAPERGAGEPDLTGEECEAFAQHVGDVFRSRGRSSDVAGRLGAAEFAVIAPNTPSGGAVRLVERLDTSVGSVTIPGAEDPRPVRIRAGYCAVPNLAESEIDAIELLLRATSALRDLRRTGDEQQIRAFEEVAVR